MTSSAFGFKAVPNGILIDPEGIIRYTKYGGFSVDKHEDVATVERFLKGEAISSGPQAVEAYVLSPAERELVETKLKLGGLLYSTGKREEALEEWQAALRYDPENLVIRKQIWAVRFPDKFHPTIDWDWQKEQLRKERQAEIEAGVCGLDGCPINRA